MSQDNLKSKLIERLEYVQLELEKKYEKIQINKKDCFLLPNDVVIHVVAVGGEYNALVIEFADNPEEAKKYNSDDGELYPIDEYPPEEMLEEMVKEIENEM